MRDRAVLFAAALLAAIGTLPTAASAQRVNPIRRSPAAPLATRLGVLVGSVSDASLGPIAEAEISILSADVRVRSNAAGRFRFIDVPLGQHLLVVRRTGFRPLAAVVELGRADTLQLRYTMEPALADGGGAPPDGPQFGPPQELGERFLLTRDEIVRRGLASSAEYVALAPGVRLVRLPNALGLSDLVAVKAGGRGRTADDPADVCALTVVVDDIRMPSRFPLDLLPAPHELAGIEVHPGTAGARVQGSAADGRCGMVIVRTRDGY
jgi:hypothetical protein